MASVVNSQKTPQRNAHLHPAHPMRRTIVPAIPLAFQKRKQQEMARARASLAAATPASPPMPVVKATPSPAQTPPPVDITPSTANGPSEVWISENPIVSSSPATPPTPATPAAEEDVQEAVVEDAKVEVLAEKETHEDIHVVPTSSPSDNQSLVSRTTYQMPPAFIPANQSNTASPATIESAEHNVANNIQQLHHTQPSTGNVMFIGYPDSSNSSPAPPLSASNVPPYPYQQPPPHSAGRQISLHLNGGPPQPMTNGYSPMGPLPPPGYYSRQDVYNNQGPTPENYSRRSMPTFGPPEGNWDPTTPRSFHGSQSSAHNDQESGPTLYTQYPPPGLSNGSNGHIDEPRFYPQHRPKAHNGSQPLAAPQNNYSVPPVSQSIPQHPVDHLDGLTFYIYSQFGDSTFADYTLELRYTDDRAQPVRIPGHNLIFARSLTLKNMMLAVSRDSNSDGPAVRNLLIESDDRFLRSDGFSLAVYRLYGGPLLDIGALAAMSLPNALSTVPGSQADRFDLALGYAAAGHLLSIPPCVNRGVEIAGHLLQWETMEKAFDFALDGGLDSQWSLRSAVRPEPCPSTYGPAVNMLIHACVNYMITNFPPGFKLETSVGEPNIRLRRLPVVHEMRSSQNPRLSFIKFGDHPTETEESTKLASVDPVTILLSKLLLNLPYYLVKFVLSSPSLGNVQGWANAKLRQEVLNAVVQEREHRRLKVLGATYISNAEREANAKDWEAVGWQERVDNVDEVTPTLGRNWVGFAVPGSES